ncbi:class I SAM-dependent methyltransferase [Halalkalibacterium halodurans]|jgi:ubiquinone/menaquinone biosynthesis C-methylase UbiE|uniref:class I SAM-dependent methyltransferase n=1 Tax=Halalkalibacterium halodurans TaxID=86665 RepID=UPI002E1E13BF|nr:class I SAM-dependent methyltransferase [Halalkalibacterium halodurans]
METNALDVNKQSWDQAAPRFFARNPLPEYGPLAPSEEELHLFGDVDRLKVLEIGCGSGHSLKYLDEKQAGELWGIDLSTKQIEVAQTVLKDSRAPVTLFESPMEVNPGLPTDYFDIVFSIYALGWTTNLTKTLENVYRYLKPGGSFIFSWEHPMYNRVRQHQHGLMVDKSYHEEGAYAHEAWSSPAIMQQYRLSTYLNHLIDHGFKVERVIEDVCLADAQKHTNGWYGYEKAQMIPTTLIIKCLKQ